MIRNEDIKRADGWLQKPTQSQKGVKGFQPVEYEIKKEIRLTTRLSRKQINVVEKYCKETDIKKSDIIRIALFEYLTTHNVNTDGEVIIDENQLNLFEK
jgi:hypothetical protein|tara:strand:- start:336 stop:632 length:297 start_codon:yes stop_codon:yes gene_type:complete